MAHRNKSIVLSLLPTIYLALIVSLLPSGVAPSEEHSPVEDTEELPSVFLAFLARNTAYLLPNFLGYLENLDYPKHKISIWSVSSVICVLALYGSV